jgi:hypothetical protein
VAIHTSSPLLASVENGFHGAASRFLVFAALNQAGRFSVPAFFILAGFLNALGAEAPSRHGSAGRHLKRRLGRLLLPYLTWSVLLCALPRLIHRQGTAVDFGMRFLFGWTFTGGYFLLALAQLTLLAPALMKVVRKGGREALVLCSVSFMAIGMLYGTAAYWNDPRARHVREAFSASLTFFPVWAPFFITGLWAGGERRRLLPWLGKHRVAFGAMAAALYVASLWELRMVLDRTGSLGLAASFLKPTSVGFALATCAFFLGQSERAAPVPPGPAADAAPIAPAWRALASGSYAIYLMHGSVVLALLPIASTWWRSLLAGPAAPIVLGVCAVGLPLAVFRLTERLAPPWARVALFG